MKIILFDHLGCHASVVAGSCLTEHINSKSSTRDILDLSNFGLYESMMPGLSLYLGRDKSGNEIYTLGVGQEPMIMIISAHDILKILGEKSDLKIIDVSSFNTPLIRLFFYIGLLKPINKIARYFCAFILKRHLPKICVFLQQELCS